MSAQIKVLEGSNSKSAGQSFTFRRIFPKGK